MRAIEPEEIAKAVESLCVRCCYELDEDVLAALEKAQRNESNIAAKIPT